MDQTILTRRRMVQGAAVALPAGTLLGAGNAAAQPAPGGYSASIISGENTALWLQELMKRQGYMAEFGVTPHYANVPDGASIPGRILSGKTDLSAQSGFGPLLPAIEKGAGFKILAGAELLPVMAVYTADPGVKRLKDLEGRSVGVGTPGTLLHMMMLALLAKHHVDVAKVKFVNIGGSFDVFKAVAAKRVDAGPSTADYLDQQQKYGVQFLPDGQFWKELPEFTLNASFTSDHAIATNREALVRVLAAYGKLYRFIQSPGSRDAFIEARTAALGKTDSSAAEGLAQWNFFQRVKPFAVNLVLSKQRVDFIQKLNIQVGKQKAMLPYEQVTDESIPRDALKLIGKV